MIGLEEFVIPDEESRTKQYREIAQLVAEAPVVKTATPSPLPVGAQHAAPGEDAWQPFATAPPAVPGESVLPSIVPDEFADNHTVELEICKRWFASDAGQVAKIEAPAGYANVRAHAMLHQAYALKQQGALLPGAQPAAPPRKFP
jgi:hypothetical protein